MRAKVTRFCQGGARKKLTIACADGGAGGSASPQRTSKTLEKIMSMHRSLAAALWLLAAVGAYVLAASWAGDAQTGKIHPWALIALFWGAALVSVAIHHLSRFLSDWLAEAADVLTRYGARHKPALSLYAGRLSGQLAEGWRELKRFWVRHKPSLPAVPTFAARLGARIGVR
jgi:hypothetical protein